MEKQKTADTLFDAGYTRIFNILLLDLVILGFLLSWKHYRKEKLKSVFTGLVSFDVSLLRPE